MHIELFLFRSRRMTVDFRVYCLNAPYIHPREGIWNVNFFVEPYLQL